MTVSANDAHPYPIYNARFRVTFPILDADGDLITGATGLDSELSQDSGTFADATNEATELATGSGMYYLDLIATELDTRSTAIIVKTSSAGGKTTPMVLYPRRLPQIRTGTAQAGAASTITLDSGASAVDDFYNGCWVNITNDSPSGALGQARMIVDYVGSTKVATIEGTWGTNPSSASTFEILLSDVALLLDPVRGLGSPTALPNAAAEAAGGLFTRGSGAGQINQPANGQVDVNVEGWNATAVPAEHTAGYPIVTVKDGAGTGEINTNAGKVVGVELVDTLTTYTGNTPQTGDVFPLASTEIADIKAKTDNLPSDPADQSLVIAATDAIMTRLGAPAGASVSADIAGVQADTDNIQTRLPAALVSGRIDASVGAMAANTMTAAALAADALAEINAEVAAALAAYDGPTHAELISEINAVQADIAALNNPSLAAIADAVVDEVFEGTLSIRQGMRILLAVLAGESTGGGTNTVNFRDNADTKNRVQATVDVNGNRTAVTLDAT